jgi:N6-adenosine-specific RNA methylase IME4
METNRLTDIPLPTTKYSIIYADPPWDYKGQLQHNGAGGKDTGGATRHYHTETTQTMKKWGICDIAEDNCLLFMWASSPHLDQAIELGKAWGFKWATVAFVWYKQKTNPGFYTLSECELCLVFKKGKIPTPRGSRKIRQMVSSLREHHSKKPIEVRHRIEQMFPCQKKIELFAREKADGWDCWGNEVDNKETSTPLLKGIEELI